MTEDSSQKECSVIKDVAVIGGGIVGCAVLHRLQLSNLSCVLLEKNGNLVSGASSGNSGIRHCGYDTEVDTLESSCIMAAGPLADRFYQVSKVPYVACGAVMVAWDQEQLEKLNVYLEKARAANQMDVCTLTRSELLDLEPNLSQDALGGLYIPGEGIIDPWLTGVGLAHMARSKGAQVFTSSEVVSGYQDDDGIWNLVTPTKIHKAKLVINAGGLYGDVVETINNSEPKFKIHPRKGDYAIFSKEARPLIKNIILPVPTETTKGIIIFPTVHGNVMVGPTAEEVEERDVSQATPSPVVVDSLVQWAHRTVPALKQVAVVGSYCGIRPATQFKDYQIQLHKERNWLTVGGIRSTGATACMGIAQHVHKLISQHMEDNPGNFNSNGIKNNTNEFESLNWKKMDEGKVVIDDMSYTVTHPITKFGLFHET